MFNPIVRNGFTPGYVWDRLEERSAETHYRVAMQCRVCEDEIQAFMERSDSVSLRCLSCQTAVHIFQVRHLTKTLDTRVIYAEVLDQIVELFRLDMRCLSCEQPLQDDESCRSSCEIQTYLVLEVISQALYVKRWIHRPHVPRERAEIPIRQPSEIEGEASESVCIQVSKAEGNRHVEQALFKLDRKEKRRALEGDGFQIATFKLPQCPLCGHFRLAFIMEDNNAVPYCPVCHYTFSYVFTGERDRVGTTIFVNIYPNISESNSPNIFNPWEELPTHPQQRRNASSTEQDEVVTRPINKTGSHPSETSVHRNDNPSVNQLSENPNAHIDVAGQILAYLREHDGIGTTKQMRAAIGCSPQGFKDAIDKLITDGQIKRVKRGFYELINRT